MQYKTKKLDILLKDTCETYYWIGFLLADGTFYEKRKAISLCLAKKDFSHLLSFRKYVESSCKITKRKYNQKSFDSVNSELYQIYISYKNVVTDIINKFGILSRKTYNPPNLPEIYNDDLFISLLIGFIDGDGNICKVGNSYSEIRLKIHKSWDNLLKQFKHRLYELLNLNHTNGWYSLNRYYVCSISNSIATKFLKSKAIEFNLPILKRKWDIIDLSFISSKEQAQHKRHIIATCLEKGKTRKEISNIVGLEYSRVCKIVKQLQKNCV